VSLVTALLAGVAILMLPDRLNRGRLAILPGAFGPSGVVARSVPRLAGGAAGVTAQDLLGLLEAIAPALEAGMSPGSALAFAADARSGAADARSGAADARSGAAELRSGAGHPDPLTALAAGMASAAADGAALGPLWREAAESADSAELLLLAHAWSLTEDMGAPLAQAVRTTVGMLEARIAHQRRLAAAVAGAKATVNVLTVLPIAGPLLALALGIGPSELYGGSGLTQASLALGLCLAGVGRWWVHRMVQAVARGPMLR